MSPLDALFMAEAMTAMVATRFAPEVQEKEELHFLKVYEQGPKILPMTDVFAWKEKTFSRGMAPVTGPSSPTKSARALGETVRTGQVFSIAEHVDLDVRFLMMAKGLNAEVPNPQQEINDNLRNLVARIQRTKNYWAAQSFLASSGSVNLGAFPNADVPSGTTLTYPIQSISALASWATAGTKIRSSEIPAAKRVYRRTCGMRAAYAIASDVVEGYITGNTELTTLAAGNPIAARIYENSLIDGDMLTVGGIDFEVARDFYVASDDSPTSVTDVISDTDLVALLPAPALWGECFTMAEGRNFVPSGPVSSLAAGNALSLIAETRGWAVWVSLEHNPMRLVLHCKWTGNLVHTTQNAACRLNTTP